MQRPRSRPDETLSRLSYAQQGQVAWFQLVAAGVTRGQVRSRVARGALHPVHRGVWSVGHPPATSASRFSAAALAGGPEAVVTARAAVMHLGLLGGEHRGPVDVLVPGRTRTRTSDPGLRIHLPRSVSVTELSRRNGVPVATAPRALADFAADATAEELATAVHRAGVRGLLAHRAAVERQLARNVDGIAALRRLVEPDGPDLRGRLEQALHRFVHRGGWPPYEPNVLVRSPIRTFRADALWRQQRFAIELDSWTFHRDRRHFEDDRLTVLAADAVGIDLKRVTWAMLHGAPGPLTALLDRRLRRDRSGSGSSCDRDPDPSDRRFITNPEGREDASLRDRMRTT